MKALQGARIRVWWCMMIMMMMNVSALKASDPIVFEIYETDYYDFLTKVRNAVAAPTLVCKLQSTQSNPKNGAYVYVQLKISDQEFVTLGLDAKDLYVWGYEDKYNGKSRATFLLGTPSAVKKDLFPSATITRTTTFGGNYNSLESSQGAGVTRRTIAVSQESLYNDIKNVYGKASPKVKEEATFFLRAIQFVPEAARFKFLEDAIPLPAVDPNTPDPFREKLIAYESNWQSISGSIRKASPKCTKIDPTLVISVSGGGYREEVKTVQEIQGEMGILKYTTGNTLSTIANSVVAADVALAFDMESPLM